MPTQTGSCVLLDVGANVNPKPEHLFQYGVMGEIFAKHVLKRPRPTIGLMNVGEEAGKGHDLAKDTHALFHASPLKEQFAVRLALEEAVVNALLHGHSGNPARPVRVCYQVTPQHWLAEVVPRDGPPAERR